MRTIEVSLTSQTCVMKWGASTASPHYLKFIPEDYEINRRKSYRVILEKGQNGWIVAKCVDIEGAISQGKNREEALRNIVEAISAILEDSFGEEVPEFFITWEEK